MREYMKMYRKKNKEKTKELQKNWVEKNKEHVRNYQKDWVRNWVEKEHNGTFKVYMLPNADYYVGYTKAIKPRMARHKQTGKDCSDYIVLHICDTKEEALEYEAIYHSIGLPGGKKNK